MKLLSLFKRSVRGFTMVELMVSIAIMMLMTWLLLSNYPESAIRMTLINNVQTTALLIREAQIRGSAIDSVNSSLGGYGIYINLVGGNTLSSIKLFGDSVGVGNGGGQSSYGLPIGNGLYDLTPIDETSSNTTLPSGYKITKICVGQAPSSVCSSDPNTSLTVSFVRPSPRPSIYLNGSKTTNYSKACIEFKSPIKYSNGHTRSVEVYNSGMIRTAIASCI